MSRWVRHPLILVALIAASICDTAAAILDDSDSIIPAQVELLTIAPSGASPVSAFGHAALLMVPEGKSWREGTLFNFNGDLVESYGKASDNKFKFYYDGIVGKSGFKVVVANPAGYFFRVLIEEGRDIQRLAIPLTRSQRAKLWSLAVSYVKDPKPLGKFKFFTQNCTSTILLLLKQAGVEINYEQIMKRNRSLGISPQQIFQLLREVLVAPFPPMRVKSLLTQIVDLSRKYNIQLGSEYIDDSKMLKPWSPEQLRILETMSLEEISLVGQSLYFLDIQRTTWVRDRIKSFQRQSTAKYIDVRPWPETFYHVCGTPECLSRARRDLEAFYSPENLRELKAMNRIELERTSQLLLPEVDLERSPQARHWRDLFSH